MSLFVKICGIARTEDAEAAVRSGADAIGVVFAQSPRRVSPERAAAVASAAREAARAARREVLVFGVFVNELPDRVRELTRAVPLDVVQLHGDESPELARALAGLRLARAVRLRGDESLRETEALAASRLFEMLLFDAYSCSARGGTGESPDWNLAARAVSIAAERGARTILAGGLRPDNVGRAVRLVRPSGVDASSGVERSPGLKDPVLVERFVAEARAADSDSAPRRPASVL